MRPPSRHQLARFQRAARALDRTLARFERLESLDGAELEAALVALDMEQLDSEMAEVRAAAAALDSEGEP